MYFKTKDDLYDVLCNIWWKINDQTSINLYREFRLNTDIIFLADFGFFTIDFTDLGTVMTVNEDTEILFSRATQKDFDKYIQKIAEAMLCRPFGMAWKKNYGHRKRESWIMPL